MKLSPEQLAQARETVTTLFDEMGLEAYLFEFEPLQDQNQWVIKVECAISEGWESFSLSASEEYLVRGKDDAVIHQFLLDEWRDVLKTCKTNRLSGD